MRAYEPTHSCIIHSELRKHGAKLLSDGGAAAEAEGEQHGPRHRVLALLSARDGPPVPLAECRSAVAGWLGDLQHNSRWGWRQDGDKPLEAYQPLPGALCSGRAVQLEAVAWAALQDPEMMPQVCCSALNEVTNCLVIFSTELVGAVVALGRRSRRSRQVQRVLPRKWFCPSSSVCSRAKSGSVTWTGHLAASTPLLAGSVRACVHKPVACFLSCFR